ncbi:Gfo/Idh/MocA family oxidoreductase [Geomonas sp. RF6]|uniref:Gfo/Idh/MocA family protein n=1 Tax=Geomonas sp. RF6 TaxID=2897342 RepID=UPI001E650888|nr:Gfo/Idh/MocA family oxidoreductase [Geomonas sp. RF6]UFS72433.1 Gfo/Idh/MocA family oxidoreductase [Geomonas sp. RF6]
MTKLNFALLGCGRIARKHAEILSRELPGAQLAAVCDIKIDRAREYGERYGVPWFTDLHVMMQTMGDRLDVVNILTESGNHARHTLELAPYGKHLVVEKPMALTLHDADAMIRACDRAGIKLFVVKQNRYNAPVLKVREALEKGRFGRLVMGTVRVRWCRPQAYYDQDAWRGTWKMDGGVFTNQASHHIDLLEWMLGEPESVFAKSTTALVDIETEDTGVAIIRFTSGALGIVEATTAARPKDLEGSLSLLGERGTVEIGGFAVNEMKVWNFADATEEDAAVLDCRQAPPNVYGFGHLPYLASVVSSIKGEAPALVDGLEGRKSLELIMAIYESIETGREVFLRFRAEKCRLGRAA